MCHPTRLLPYTSRMYASDSILYWKASVKSSNYRIQFVNQTITNKFSVSHDSDYPIHMSWAQLKHVSSSGNFNLIDCLS